MLKGFITFFILSMNGWAVPVPISEEELKQELKKEIDNVMPISDEFEISLSLPQNIIQKEKDDDSVLIQDISFDQNSYHFKAKVTTAINANKKKEMIIRGQLKLLLNVPVLNHLVNPGDEIVESDITWQKKPANLVNSSVIQNKEYLIGKTPQSTPLKPGMIIRKSDIKAPILIKRNDAIHITYKDEGIIISTIGQAKQDGSRGDLIRFSIPNSKKEIHAMVVAKGQAEILVAG